MYFKFTLPLLLLYLFFLTGCREPLIAFSSDREGNYEICTVNLKGKEFKNLTKNPLGDFAPDWSPDGKKIIFYSYRDRENEEDKNTEIYIMNSDGTNQTRLTENKSYDIMPDFSLNGKKIAFSSDRDFEAIFDIFIMNSDGSEEVNITKSEDASEKGPDWLDEDTLVFQRIYLVDGLIKISEDTLTALKDKKVKDKLDTAKLKSLLDISLSKEELEFELKNMKFNDKQIKLILEKASPVPQKKSHIFTVNIDGSGLKQLTETIYEYHTPACSPDKTRVAFSREDETGFLNIYVMNLDGTNMISVTKDKYYHDECPSWSPDSRRLTFSSLREDGRHICIFDLTDSKQEFLLDPCPLEDITPAWSPFF